MRPIEQEHPCNTYVQHMPCASLRAFPPTPVKKFEQVTIKPLGLLAASAPSYPTGCALMRPACCKWSLRASTNSATHHTRCSRLKSGSMATTCSNLTCWVHNEINIARSKIRIQKNGRTERIYRRKIGVKTRDLDGPRAYIYRRVLQSL